MKTTEMDLDDYFETLYKKAEWEMIPEYMVESIKNWVENGWPGGTLLQAVLRHDFQAVIWHDDSVNQHDLDRWVQFLKSYPDECYGSDEKVRDWEAKGGLRGKTRYDVSSQHLP